MTHGVAAHISNGNMHDLAHFPATNLAPDINLSIPPQSTISPSKEQ
jgi:hypothetical protein